MVSEVKYSDVLVDTNKESERAVSLHKEEFSGELYDLDEKIKTMMVTGNIIAGKRTAFICQVCGKTGQWMQIRDHI